MIQKREVLAAMLLAMCKDSFNVGLFLGKQIGNVTPIRPVAPPTYNDIDDTSPITAAVAVQAIPGAFIRMLRESARKDEFLTTADLMLATTDIVEVEDDEEENKDKKECSPHRD